MEELGLGQDGVLRNRRLLGRLVSLEEGNDVWGDARPFEIEGGVFGIAASTARNRT
jgi:hypothetical protein